MSDHPPGLVAVPAMDWIYTRPAISLQSVAMNLPDGSRWTWQFGNSPTIASKRNRSARELLDSDREWLLFLDSDMTFPQDVVPRLLQVDADIACGLQTFKRPQQEYAAVAERVTNLPEDAPDRRPTDHPEFDSRNIDLRKVIQGETDVVDVDVAGTGCMMIRRHVLEGLDPPHFEANRDEWEGMNENYNFCLRAKRAGLSVKVDTRVRCRHIGAHGIGLAEAVGWQAVQHYEKQTERGEDQTRGGPATPHRRSGA